MIQFADTRKVPQGPGHYVFVYVCNFCDLFDSLPVRVGIEKTYVLCERASQ